MGECPNYIFLLLTLLVFNSTFAYSTKIDPVLRETLKRDGHSNILVSMKAGTTDILNNLARVSFSSRTERSQAVYNALTARAQKSQSQILSFVAVPATLNTYKLGKVQSLWITNQIGIQNASREFIELLASMDEISRIQEDEIVQLHEPIEINEGPVRITDNLQWNIAQIQAPAAWLMLGGNNGNGITVANLDTGVRYTHEILINNYKNDGHSWYDPYNNTEIPADNNGHGTHTMGTMVGENGFGAAPGAQWIACKGIYDDGSGSGTMMLACGQFVICPTTPSGSDADCSKTPHVVSNSWTTSGGSKYYDNMIAAWHAAGIVPVFANGNSGPNCATVNSPSDSDDVISVGSTTNTDSLSSFSSVGPTLYNTTKPDISAPGDSVISSYSLSDSTYAYMSGTSMACPHVAGSIALLLSRNPNLSYEQIQSLLLSNPDQNLSFSGATCGGIPDNAFENNHFGFGRLNIYKALQALVNMG